MSIHIQQELKARGLAQVVVILKSALSTRGTRATATRLAPSTAGAASLVKHFVSSETSQRSALLMAAAETPAAFNLASQKATRRSPGRAGVSIPTSTAGDAAAPVRMYPNLGVMLGTVTKEGLAKLRAEPGVGAVVGAPSLSLIRPDRKAVARLTRKIAWGIQAIAAPKLWKKGLTGKSVFVGHLDTGADVKHKTLKTAITAFADFDFLGRLRTPSPDPYDTADHGTHTAATIAGRPVAGRYVGVAFGASLASAIVIEGGEVIARVLGGMDWAVGEGVRILSMSLGFRGWWEDFLPITQLLRERGVLPVFAVGNEGPGTSRSPGNYVEALSVGAYNKGGNVAGFSSSQLFGRAVDAVVPDVVAPGVSIVSARPGGGYQAMDGSSMATPHVAGLAALLFEAKPDATVDEVERAIFESCRRTPGMTVNRANRGVPDAAKALAHLTEASTS